MAWISLQRLGPIPWAQRVWGLPFLTVLAPSKRVHAARVPLRGRQMLLHLRRKLPEPTLVPAISVLLAFPTWRAQR